MAHGTPAGQTYVLRKTRSKSSFHREHYSLARRLGRKTKDTTTRYALRRMTRQWVNSLPLTPVYGTKGHGEAMSSERSLRPAPRHRPVVLYSRDFPFAVATEEFRTSSVFSDEEIASPAGEISRSFLQFLHLLHERSRVSVLSR